MKYRKRRKWKYSLEETEFRFVGNDLPDIEFGFILIENGMMTILKGYAWDGASGPTIDTKNSMTPSLYHDAFYQLFREGVLDCKFKKVADDLFYELLKERGMSNLRARLWWIAVTKFGPTSSYVLEAP